jgi:PelA/Pel-15E family pectate lyase
MVASFQMEGSNMKKALIYLLVVIMTMSTANVGVIAATLETSAKPVETFTPSNYSKLDSPNTIENKNLVLRSSGSTYLDAKYDISLKPNTEYTIVWNIKKNTYSSGSFVALRARDFLVGSDIKFPRQETGEFVATFKTVSNIKNPYIWSFAYNNTTNPDMEIVADFVLYETADLEAARLAEEEAARLAEEQAARLAAEQAVAEEAARLAEEQEAARLAEEQAAAEKQTAGSPSAVERFTPSKYSKLDSPNRIENNNLVLRSSGKTYLNAKYDIALKPNTDYTIVWNIKKNTFSSGSFVALRARDFLVGSDIRFPRQETGEFIATFKTVSNIKNPYIWSFAYNNTTNPDMEIVADFVLYESADFEAARQAEEQVGSEEAARLAAEEEATRLATEQAAAEDAARLAAEEEAARLAAEQAAAEEAARLAAEQAAAEEAARLAAEQAAAEEAARLAAEQAAAEEAARLAAEQLKAVETFSPSKYSLIKSPSRIENNNLVLASLGSTYIDAKYDIALKPDTEYTIVWNIKKNTYSSGSFVALRARDFLVGSDIKFPRQETGEFVVNFKTVSNIKNPYIWSFAYNNTTNPNMEIVADFKIYLASDYANQTSGSDNSTEVVEVIEAPKVLTEEEKIAMYVISWQMDHGGWGKNKTELYTRPWDGVERKSGDNFKIEVGSIDNSATVNEIKYLMNVYNKTGNEVIKQAALKGLNFLLTMQYDTGAIPQVYPRVNSKDYPYFDAATFNDDATVNVLTFYQSILSDRNTYKSNLINATDYARVERAYKLGIEYILKSQITANGVLTAWGAQHDPITYQPIKAREYELVSISGYESVNIVRFLISLGNSDPRVVKSVEAAVVWFNKVGVANTKYNRYATNGTYFEYAPGQTMWYRFYEIGTNRGFFANRDGIKVYDIMQVLEERRHGYVWAGNWGRLIVGFKY